MPLVWSLPEHPSSRVGDDVDNALWDDGATLFGCLRPRPRDCDKRISSGKCFGAG
jgi:hypothetical protein